MNQFFNPTPVLIAQLAVSAFFSILFIQSGLDKLINFRENLSWLMGHFSKTVLKGLVPVMLILVTCSETLAGFISLYGVLQLILHENTVFSLMGCYLGTLSFLFLFFGQRIAKDYAGAGSLVPYFLTAIVSILLLSI